ncbi:MAG: CRTAC1 family protein, partial [Gammaproteobacteria bacterium]|nr:CRTAC1 family protein [Gammaproteobacteria bacterium]
DNAGDMDMMVVNLAGQTDSFFRNENGYFRDVTAELGLGITGRFTRFGVTLADFDNDGLLDLFEANGKVSAPSASVTQDEQSEGTIFDEPNVLLRGMPGGRFEELAPRGGVAEPLEHTSRGLAVGDVNDDGGLDLLIINRDAPPYLLMNRAPERGNWIRFRPVLGDPPRDAYGATVSAVVDGTRVWRDVQPDGSYLAYSDPRPHFGLGDEPEVEDVTVRWPGETEVEHFGDFDAGQTVELKRGAGQR